MSLAEPAAPLAPQIIRGMPQDDYRRLQAVSYSTLRHFARSPLHARHAMTAGAEPTEAMRLGSLVDSLVLTPAERLRRFTARPAGIDRRTKAGKEAYTEWEATVGDRLVVTSETMDTAMDVAAAVEAHPAAAHLLSLPGARQVAVVASLGGVRVRGLIDAVAIADTCTWVVDLKTTRNASRDGFLPSVHRYAYHWQAACYLELLNVAADSRRRRFAWICAETSPPYAVAVYEATDAMIDLGWRELQAALADYRRCVDTGQWPGYPEDVQRLDPPRWWASRGYERVTEDQDEETSGDE